MIILDEKHTVIIVEGEFDENFVITEESLKGVLIGDLITIGVGTYDKKDDNLEVDTALVGKYDLLTRQHLVVGKHIHDLYVSRKKKEKK